MFIYSSHSGHPWRHYGNWKDITLQFQEAVKGKTVLQGVNNNKLYQLIQTILDLKLGELLHDDLFGLFEAMSAIEMMDPKMDAGMMCIRGARKIVSFDQALQVCTNT